MHNVQYMVNTNNAYSAMIIVCERGLCQNHLAAGCRRTRMAAKGAGAGGKK